MVPNSTRWSAWDKNLFLTSATSSAELVYGVNAAGKLVHVSEVLPGAACACHCPNPRCGRPLVAKVRQITPNQYGRFKAQHFAHEANQACANAPESALHLLAKETIESALRLLLPEVKANYHDQTRLLHKAREVTFTKAVREATVLKNVIPDLYMERDGRLLLIEIYVTHACVREKITELKKRGIATVEIDLSDFPRDASRADITRAVLQTAPRYWVFHPKIEGAVEAMKQEAERRQREAKEAFEQRVDALAAAYATGLNDLGEKTAPRFSCKDDVFRLGLGKYIGLKSDGAGCFNVSPRVWQHRLLQHAFIPRDGEAKHYRVKALFDWFKKHDLVRRAFRFVPPELEKALLQRGLGFATPYRAIEQYLDTLAAHGALQAGPSYSLRSEVRHQLAAMRHADDLRRSRTEDVLDRIGKILQALPEDERQGLTAEEWIARRHGDAMSCQEAIEKDEAQFDSIIRALRRVEGMMFCNGAIMQETLGLPVDSERERQRHARQAEADAKEAARLEAARVARDNRQERLMTAARALGSNGHEWLSAPNPKLGGSRPIEMAVSGEAELDRVLVEINREAHQREQTRRREETIAALRVGLVDEVTKILDDAAQPFLNSPYKELGNKRPIDYCRSDETYLACRTLAVKVKKQRRR